MKFEETTANQCRYSECIPTWFKELEVVEDLSQEDYSGEVCILSKKGDKYIVLQYAYGSCSGCDAWEDLDLSDEQITKEIESLILEVDEEKLKHLNFGFSSQKHIPNPETCCNCKECKKYENGDFDD